MIIDHKYSHFACAMFIKDIQGGYIWVNESLLRLQKIRAIDILGKVDENLPWSSHTKELSLHDQQILDERLPCVFKETIIRRGQAVDGFCHKSPVYSQQGELAGIAGVFIDAPNSINTHNKLSIREKQCLRNLAHGLTAKVSAQQLKLSPRTVENYLEKLRDKLHCKNQAELIAFYFEKYRTQS